MSRHISAHLGADRADSLTSRSFSTGRVSRRTEDAYAQGHPIMLRHIFRLDGFPHRTITGSLDPLCPSRRHLDGPAGLVMVDAFHRRRVLDRDGDVDS